MGRCHWNTCSLFSYLDIWWFERIVEMVLSPCRCLGKKEKKLFPFLSLLLSLSLSHTHKYGGASWGGEQAWPGRTARNTCNRLVFLMLGNKSSHPSLASPSPPSVDLIGWGAPTHNTHCNTHMQNKYSIKHWNLDGSMDVFILSSSVIIHCRVCCKLNYTTLT